MNTGEVAAFFAGEGLGVSTRGGLRVSTREVHGGEGSVADTGTSPSMAGASSSMAES